MEQKSSGGKRDPGRGGIGRHKRRAHLIIVARNLRQSQPFVPLQLFCCHVRTPGLHRLTSGSRAISVLHSPPPPQPTSLFISLPPRPNFNQTLIAPQQIVAATKLASLEPSRREVSLKRTIRFHTSSSSSWNNRPSKIGPGGCDI